MCYTCKNEHIIQHKVKQLADGSQAVTDLVWQYLVQSVAVTAQCNTAVGCHVVYIYVLVEVNDKFALWMNLVHNTNNNSVKPVN